MTTTEHLIEWDLHRLLSGDLSFKTPYSKNQLHGLHTYAARFPGGLPRYFIEGLSDVGETVLDPMSGSGATLVEGWLLGRNVVGVDLDPLAVRQSLAKTTAVDPDTLSRFGVNVLAHAHELCAGYRAFDSVAETWDQETRKFVDYWFLPQTQHELAALVLAIRAVTSLEMRRLLEVLFSSVIVTKSGGVSLARDLAHSRPHKVSAKEPKNAIKRFQAVLTTAIKTFDSIKGVQKGHARVIHADSRAVPLSNDSVDLIVTSPPYANALDYVRAHKFSLVWLGESIPALKSLRSQYVGSERLPDRDISLPYSVSAAVSTIGVSDLHKSRVVEKYFSDMRLVLGEMLRVLKPGKAGVVVVGPSTIRGAALETHTHLATLASHEGFKVVGVEKRELDRDRRMMPARFNHDNSGIERRIHEEYVIGLLKD